MKTLVERWARASLALAQQEDAGSYDESSPLHLIRRRASAVFPRATKEMIARTEERLGVDLGSDLREFYGISNGFVDVEPMVSVTRLLCLDEMDWFRSSCPELWEVYMELDEDFPTEGRGLSRRERLSRYVVFSEETDPTTAPLYMVDTSASGPAVISFVIEEGEFNSFQTFRDFVAFRCKRTERALRGTGL